MVENINKTFWKQLTSTALSCSMVWSLCSWSY